MGNGAMYGLPDHFARPVEFCADYVGRAWNRGIERDAKHGELRMGRD